MNFSRLVFPILFMLTAFSAGAADPYAVDDVLVGSSRINLEPGASQNLKIEQTGRARNPSLDTALSGQSNIQVTPTPQRGSNITLDGLSGSEVAIDWDGDPVLGRVDGALDARTVSLGTASQVSVYHGLDSLPYGSQNIAGVISLESPWEENRHLELKSSGGSYGRTLLSGKVSGASAERFNYAATVGNWRTGAIQANPNSQDTTSSAASQLSASVLASKTELGDVAGKPVDMRVGGSGFNENSKFISLGSPGEAIQRRIHVYSDVRREKSLWHLSFNDFEQQSGALGASPSYTFQERAFRFGPELQETVSRFTLYGGAIGDIHSTQSTRIPTGTVNQAELGSYAGARYALTDHWTLGAGSRWDTGPHLASPRADVQYAFDDGVFEHVTMLESGLGFREVTPKERYLDFTNAAGGGYRLVGNPGLKTERAWMTALRHSAKAKRLTLTGALFQVKLTDTIGYQGTTDGSGAITYANVGRSQNYGAQAGARYRVIEYWETGASYQWLRGWNSTTQSPSFLSPEHRVALELARNPERGITVLGQAVYTSKQGYFDFNHDGVVDASDWAPAYWMTNLEAGYGFRWAGVAEVMRVFGRVDNALDVVHPLTLPVEPRTFLLGASVEL